jgi:phosphopantetheinyl transferase (holo-ACP synthase)
LLPKEHQLDNIIIAGSMSEQELAAMFIKQQEGMTGQAKARGSSPFWEGVVVLPNTDGKEQSANLLTWKKAYEKETGHKVLHMSIHLDEGYIDADGSPQYNPHSHVIVSRMDARNRVINLDRKQLAKVQDLTAEMLQMERGSTLEERNGRRGRKHVPHREFRAQANEKRLELVDAKNQVTDLQADNKTAMEQERIKNAEATRKIGEQANEIALLKARYAADRASLKASGEATQRNYQDLKIAHDLALKDLAQTKKSTAEKIIELETKLAAVQAKIPVPAVVVLTFETTSAAFEDLGRNQEAARIVQDAAERIDQGWDGKSFPLNDTNGNEVGICEEVEGNDIPDIPAGGIQVELTRGQNLSNVLRRVSDRLQTMAASGFHRIRDKLGNVIARLSINPPTQPNAELDPYERPNRP